MFVSTEGLVLHQTKYSETDKILTIFTKKNGKIQAIAKGARNPKSSLIATTQVFCHSNLMLYKGKSFYHINQGEVLNSFYNLRDDLYKLAYATYMIELISVGVADEEPNTKLFEMIIKALKVLSESKQDLNKLTIAFMLKYISFIGYKPYLRGCVICGGAIGNKVMFSSIHGGVVCDKCFKKEYYGKYINNTVLGKIQELLYIPLDNVNSIELNKNELSIIENEITKYVFSYIEKKSLKSLEFIHALDK